MDATLAQARSAFSRREWGTAYRLLLAPAGEAEAAVEDLERLATAAYMVGKDDDCTEAWSRAYQAHAGRGATAAAARCAFWLGWGLFYKGQMAQANGWFQRAQRLVDEHGGDCAERGLLLVPRGVIELFGQNDAAAGRETFAEAHRIGERFGEPDLIGFGALGQGQALIRLGRREEGLALLDEVMATVTAGELSAMAAGTVYCAVILECRRIFDLRRASEWTAALKAWCDSDPSLVPYRGQCLVHRSEIMQLRGDWSEALGEAERAADLLAQPPPQPAVGMAYYQLGELHRLGGQFRRAEEAYQQASRWGRDPQPGLALLRLAQGNAGAAFVSLARLLEETGDVTVRAALLPAYVEAALAATRTSEARRAAEELAALATELASPALEATAAYAGGAVSLAEGDPAGGCRELRRARAGWQDLEAPYEAARARVLIGVACRDLGDTDAAALELDAARWVFEKLAAHPDLDRLVQLEGSRSTQGQGRAVGTRAAGARPRDRRQDQSRHRPHADPQRAHRPSPHPEHLRQDGGVVSGRGNRLRPPARPRLIPALVRTSHAPSSPNWYARAMRGGRATVTIGVTAPIPRRRTRCTWSYSTRSRTRRRRLPEGRSSWPVKERPLACACSSSTRAPTGPP